MSYNQSTCEQRGVFLVLFAVVLIALLAMLGIMVGSGFLASDRTQIQNISNNTALAMIEGYSSTRSRNFYLRACAGRTRAERVLNLNELKGFHLSGARINSSTFPDGADIIASTPQDATQHDRCSPTINPASGDAGANLTFGTWIEEQGSDPNYIIGDAATGSVGCKMRDGHQDPTGTLKYPCFLEENSPSVETQISAVRADLSTANEPPFFIPFAGRMAGISAKSFGVVVPRCFAGVVDLSYSSVNETHPLPSNSDGIFAASAVLPDGRRAYGAPICPSCNNPASNSLAEACNEVVSSAGVQICVDNGGGNWLCHAENRDNINNYVDPSFLSGGWVRPWLPQRDQRFFPRFDGTDTSVEPPFLGLPFIPVQFLQLGTSAPDNPSPVFATHSNCAHPLSAGELPIGGTDQSYTGMVWCNMWRGRNSHDSVTPYWNADNGCAAGVRELERLVSEGETSKLAHFWSDYDPNPVALTGYRPTNTASWFPEPQQSPYGPLLVDRLISKPDANGVVASAGPEPLSRYLSAMNAAFRLVSEQSAAGDRALVLGFAGDLMYRGDDPNARIGTPRKPFQVAVVPGIGMENEGGATQDFALLAQVTNPLSRGAFYWDAPNHTYVGAPARNKTHPLAEYHPNFVDVGLVSRFVYPTASNPSRVVDTNILKGLLDARARLQNPNNGAGCGPGSLKSIVLFTDGINTCAPKASFPSSVPQTPGDDSTSWYNRLLSGPPAPTFTDPDYFHCKSGGESDFQDFYLRYEDFLFGGPTFHAGSSEPSGLSQALQQDRIAFSAVIDGQSLGAIWRRVLRPDSSTEYLRISELKIASPALKRQAFNFDSVTRSGVMDNLGSDRNTRDANAYSRAGSSAYFRRPIDTLGRLAAETGGILWPILPKCVPANTPGCPNTGCYESDAAGAELLDSVWAANGNQLTCSPLNYSESEQAAYVMIDSIGQKPYSLREPVGGDIN